MVKFKIIYILIGILFFANSCKKDDVAPQLEVTVINDTQQTVISATVSLYASEQDWEGQINPVLSSQTNSQGKVVFTDLKELVYYIYVTKDGLSNYTTDNKLKDPLKINTLVKVTITIK